jgi:hypothetical protein
MTDWDKHRVKLVHLGEKVIQLDGWKEDRLMQMMDNCNKSWKRRRRPWKGSK